ncbi:glycoside hydrolase family 65 protein [Bacillus thuringiensis]|uniref:Family 65 glycosyl hydrolase n=1 Tax=Bacillus thuringiensis serovar mexicanensis TaxID=180868 RepID=A0A242WFQ7_BACTU|nr:MULTISPECIES: glycosyl hydrolase family 65 protein [Bacillus cereus group]EEM56425.1 Kojibiose phosphorylase [Bacillus thuringiensis serovar monterrey BGSC 4AJ1]KAB5639538.1 glycoside hydrolase family 65 protein [Bacillus thuringiensis]MEB9670108.1 glycosyl hydrolase family 65 protein [Bacillus anthracis]OTW55669.1 family 65 glycosyl hydrolase [Bacillus thuringiensis serovar mexicanensis]OTX05520.1 family 65 glycosyl hydrolase [Bacillus thuringiensis serovar monterrey]
MKNQIMKYDVDSDQFKNWLVSETQFNSELLGKCEAIFCLGNGYMGQRAAMEERYVKETRNLFVGGTFNKFAENEVTELPNAADVLWVDLKLNNELFNLERGKIHDYNRTLHLKNAELMRKVTWESPSGDLFELVFRRFISLDDRHVIAQRVEVTPLSDGAEIEVTSGINAQMTNSGVQHFIEGEKRLFNGKFMQLIQTTTESKVDFIFNTVHSAKKNNQAIETEGLILMDRRTIYFNYKPIKVEKGETLVFEKLTNVFTSRDNDYKGDTYSLEQLRENSLTHIKELSTKSYDKLFTAHVEAWEDKVWNFSPITIESESGFDQLAIRFAQYHMTVMTPAHDNRMNIGAKGLSGEGYKGHTFWDTEIFLLPHFIYTNPKTARSLLEYRYNTLEGAHRKAKDNGYEGAMFPWESAWLEDGEVTPVWGAADIITGKATKIWSGFIEQHITFDIAFATWQYFQITNDEDFMLKNGYELLFDTAKFWASRLEWNVEKQEYHINEVVGPDEYKEHVDNNAFTNYTAYWNIKKAMEYYHMLKANHPQLFRELDQKLELERTYKNWEQKVEKIYLPQPREEDLVIPQDDTYLSLEIMDLTKYKKQEHIGSMFKDYNLEQVNKIQVSKQADIMVLFYLLEDMFNDEVKRANWEYYEPKTLHDSSLSLSTHCVLACDMGDYEMAYDLFTRAAKIDLGPNMKTSDHGVHAASLGGIWQCIVNGFGGVRMLNGELRVSPHIPAEWSELQFEMNWHGDLIKVIATKEEITLEKLTSINDSISLAIYDQKVNLVDKICMPAKR